MSVNNEGDKDLNSLKDALCSLVAASKEITMRQLLSKYRQSNGYIPLQRYGYQNVQKFIWEQFSDCFIFGGSPFNPTLTLKDPQSTQSVKNSERQNNDTNRNIPKNCKATYKTPRWPQRASNAPSTSRANTSRNNSNHINTTLNSTKSRLENRELETEPDWTDSDKEEVNGPCKKLVTVGPDGKQTCDVVEFKRVMRKLSNATKRERWKKEEPLRHVRALVLQSPEAIWCSELMQLYREFYGRELDYNYYITVTRLVKHVPDVKVTYCPDRGDYLLSNAKRPISYEPTDKVAVYPLDCLQRRDRILPVCTVAELKVGDALTVELTEIYSPSIFWLRRVDDDAGFSYLMAYMQFYYQYEVDAHVRRLHPEAVQAGYYCASRWREEWRRSLIVSVMYDSEPPRVKVLHVDYGRLAKCSAKELWPLPIEFSKVGTQAIRAHLAGVRPAAPDRMWPHNTTERFVKMTRNQKISAVVTAVDLSDLSLELQLMLSVKGKLVSVADELLRAGHADPRSEPALEMKEYYLYPGFNALENGFTPSFEEISRFLRDDIDPYSIKEYRQYMPPSNCIPYSDRRISDIFPRHRCKCDICYAQVNRLRSQVANLKLN